MAHAVPPLIHRDVPRRPSPDIDARPSGAIARFWISGRYAGNARCVTRTCVQECRSTHRRLVVAQHDPRHDAAAGIDGRVQHDTSSATYSTSIGVTIADSGSN